MNGMSTTGKAISGLEHLRQSIADIITTPIGTRVMRRDYGSLVPSLIDSPQNPATTVRLYSAITSALMRWEPRLRLSRLAITHTDAGAAVLDLEGENTETGNAVSLQVPLQLGAA
ncbi:baseplate assembly protein [Halopseudomonas oceani]|uniref:Baseplate assembly protein n=1 Tax=Halopseudomonas oceani TaxID=1708783 RepID=A0A2P4EUB7_9GAMM|nr:GPW/gp25 family protein [Halopseudomonas oceani]POB03020.1 baseplate assembly protein [Halopseudomonas oceani]GGE50583.1 baseplate assembly protein [Halopseudomonas oceani]